MELIFKRIRQIIITGLILIIVGFLLMVGVYSLPTERMKENAKAAVVIIDREGLYPYLYDEEVIPPRIRELKWIRALFYNRRAFTRDNFTDAVMLGTAVYEEQGVSKIHAAMKNAKNGVDDPGQGLRDYVVNGKRGDSSDYSRYWHGYLVVLKPLLLIMNYNQIRMLNVVIQLLLVGGIFYVMYVKMRSKLEFLLFGYSLLFMCPVIIPLSLQYSNMTYLMLTCVLIVLVQHEYLREKYRFWIFYFIVGMLTSYFDFLTFPLITLGMPLTLQLNMDCIEKVSLKWKQIVQSALMWATGYAVMWAVKWGLASIILQKNVIENAIAQATLRMSSPYSRMEMTASRAIFANLLSLGNFIFLLLVLLGMYLVIHRMIKQKQICTDFRIYAVYMPVIIMPFLWYAVLQNHSCSHGFFTYRSLIITIYAGMSMLLRGVNSIKWDKTCKSKSVYLKSGTKQG